MAIGCKLGQFGSRTAFTYYKIGSIYTLLCSGSHGEARAHKNGLLLELHALTQVARSYALLDEVIMWLFDFSLALG